MATPDLSAIASGFFEKGPELFMKQVNAWDLAKSGIQLYRNVKAPIVLPKIAAAGGPRPYRTQDDTSSNGVAFTDRTLTVRQSKWDFDFDPENFRNTYLNDGTDTPFYQSALMQIANEYLAAINNSTMGAGVYNGAGTTAAALADGYLTLISDAAGAGDITPVATGAVSASNAVTKVEEIWDALPAWMKAKPEVLFLMSYQNFSYYRTHYRATFNSSFQPNVNGEYTLDAFPNAKIKPVSWLGSSPRIIATIPGNLVAGTDGESVKVAATPHRNIIEVRAMMPIGFQIADLDALFVNNQS